MLRSTRRSLTQPSPPAGSKLWLFTMERISDRAANWGRARAGIVAATPSMSHRSLVTWPPTWATARAACLLSTPVTITESTSLPSCSYRPASTYARTPFPVPVWGRPGASSVVASTMTSIKLVSICMEVLQKGLSKKASGENKRSKMVHFVSYLYYSRKLSQSP